MCLQNKILSKTFLKRSLLILLFKNCEYNAFMLHTDKQKNAMNGKVKLIQHSLKTSKVNLLHPTC